MASAAPVFEEVLETFTTGESGLLVRPGPDQDAGQAKAELERALSGVPASEVRWEVLIDETDHPWVLVRQSGLAALAVATQGIGDALVASGLGARVLAVVYPFRWQDRKIYWIYQPRIKALTPFAPKDVNLEEERDHPLELRMEHAVRRELPTSREVAQWYPIWGMPL
jgi:hypothetical protein